MSIHNTDPVPSNTGPASSKSSEIEQVASNSPPPSTDARPEISSHKRFSFLRNFFGSLGSKTPPANSPSTGPQQPLSATGQPSPTSAPQALINGMSNAQLRDFFELEIAKNRDFLGAGKTNDSSLIPQAYLNTKRPSSNSPNSEHLTGTARALANLKKLDVKQLDTLYSHLKTAKQDPQQKAAQYVLASLKSNHFDILKILLKTIPPNASLDTVTELYTKSFR